MVDGKNGYLVPHTEKDKFVERIVELLDNPQQRKSMGVQAIEMAKEYSIQKMVVKYVNLYTEMLSSDMRGDVSHFVDSYHS